MAKGRGSGLWLSFQEGEILATERSHAGTQEEPSGKLRGDLVSWCTRFLTLALPWEPDGLQL